VIDNYDSFVYNLVQYLGQLGAEPLVYRNDAIDVATARWLRPDGLLVSPGPGRPDTAGVSKALIAELAGSVPVLGVCLGHQSMVEAFGGRTVRGDPVHGKDAEVEHDGRGVLSGLESPIRVGRYHSLVADPELPDELELTASYGDVVMGIRHRTLPAEGVQFHPESVLTPQGRAMLQNFLN
jgi:anthranilate synthase/aminodeoxychorismate synthase-like glutamine amidotransferase